MPEYRKSALSLYQLAGKDRQWLLARLPQQHRGRLESLLAELESLGIPRQGYDAAAIEDKSDTSDAALTPQDIQLIDAAAAEEIATLLRGEAAAVVAAVLSLHDWRWRPSFLGQYLPPERKAIAMGIEAGRRNGITPALRAALPASLARMLRNLRAERFEADRDHKAVVYRSRPGLLQRGLRMLWPA